MPAPPPKKNQKKILIYAGVAGAVLAVLMLVKKRQGAAGESEPGGPTYTSAPSSIPAGGAGAGGQELATFEQQLSQQLPEAIASGVRAGFEANQTQATPNNLPELLAGVGGLITALRPNGLGEQVGGTSPSPSQPAPSPEPAPTPAAPPPAPVAAPPAPKPAPKPAPPPAWKAITCGNGCPGHRYPDGHAECMRKDSHGHCYW